MVPALVALVLVAADLPADGTSYRASIEQWRRQREAELRAPDGWLSLAGLFWLKEGTNWAGSRPGSDVALPAGKVSESIGVFELHGGAVRFRAAKGARVLVNGKTVSDVALKSDAGAQQPDIVQAGSITMYVIQRGARAGIRVKDPESEARRGFAGLHWYPVREEYRVVASFHGYNPPKILSVPTVLGTPDPEPSPGYAEFRLRGKLLRLEPTIEDGLLFFVFRDLTAGKSTYGAGRFLKTAMPDNGSVVLDFNKAYNPPCAFTPYATCPLPTPANRLPIAIEAGELNYGAH